MATVIEHPEELSATDQAVLDRIEREAAEAQQEDDLSQVTQVVTDEIGKFAADPNAWMSIAANTVGEAMFWWGDQMGMGEDAIRGQISLYLEDMLRAIELNLMIPADILFAKEYTRDTDGPESLGRQFYMQNPKGVDRLAAFALNWFGREAGIPLRTPPIQRTGRRGAAGPKSLTAEEIRAKFDIDELSNSINDLNRMLVLEDHADSKKMARDYIESVVDTKGEQVIDFETFVRERIEGTARFKSIYRNKPDALSAEQYMAPYFAQALAVASPDEAAELAIGAAGSASSQQAFAQRLRRTDAVTGSTGFIGSLQGKLERLGDVLKG